MWRAISSAHSQRFAGACSKTCRGRPGQPNQNKLPPSSGWRLAEKEKVSRMELDLGYTMCYIMTCGLTWLAWKKVKAEPGPSSFWFPECQQVQGNQEKKTRDQNTSCLEFFPYAIHFPIASFRSQGNFTPNQHHQTLLQVADPWTQPGLWDCCGWPFQTTNPRSNGHLGDLKWLG